jgi:hypothetical protein
MSSARRPRRRRHALPASLPQAVHVREQAGQLVLPAPRNRFKRYRVRAGRFLNRKRVQQGKFATVVRTAELEPAVAALNARGVALGPWVTGPHPLAMDSRGTFGTQFVLERNRA